VITIWSGGAPLKWQDSLIEGMVLECRSFVGSNIEVVEELIRDIEALGEEDRDWHIEDSCAIGLPWLVALGGLVEAVGLVTTFEVLRSLGVAAAPIVLMNQAEPLYRASSLVTQGGYTASSRPSHGRERGVTVTPPWILDDAYELVGLGRGGPGFGSDTSAVLREWLGYSDETITVLRKLGAFR
jgi:hypothetical protein